MKKFERLSRDLTGWNIARNPNFCLKNIGHVNVSGGLPCQKFS